MVVPREPQSEACLMDNGKDNGIFNTTVFYSKHAPKNVRAKVSL